MARIIPLGTNTTFILRTRNASGALVNADSTPTVDDALVNGVSTAITSTVAQAQDDVPANITGTYTVQVTTNTLNEGDDLALLVTAEIGGVTRTTELHGVVMSTGGGPSIQGS